VAQEAESNRDGLDSFIVAGEGRRVGGLFYFRAQLALKSAIACSRQQRAFREMPCPLSF
jgi:hypothetical protein